MHVCTFLALCAAYLSGHQRGGRLDVLPVHVLTSCATTRALFFSSDGSEVLKATQGMPPTKRSAEFST